MPVPSFIPQRSPSARRVTQLLVALMAVLAMLAGCGSAGSDVAEPVTGAASQVDPPANDAAVQVEAESTQAGDLAANEADAEAEQAMEPLATAAAIAKADEPAADSPEEPAPDQTDTTGLANGLDALNRDFGSNATTCPSIEYAAGSTSPDDLLAARDCLITEVSAGRPVVSDFMLTTTEGDPVYYRYAFDGDRILFVNDSRLDTYGSGEVNAQLCDGVEAGRILPEVFGCIPTNSSGLSQADG